MTIQDYVCEWIVSEHKGKVQGRGDKLLGEEEGERQNPNKPSVNLDYMLDRW